MTNKPKIRLMSIKDGKYSVKIPGVDFIVKVNESIYKLWVSGQVKPKNT